MSRAGEGNSLSQTARGDGVVARLDEVLRSSGWVDDGLAGAELKLRAVELEAVEEIKGVFGERVSGVSVSFLRGGGTGRVEMAGFLVCF